MKERRLRVAIYHAGEDFFAKSEVGPLMEIVSHNFAIFDSVKYWLDFEICIKNHSRSLKMVQFRSLGAVSYSRSRVTTSLSGIISEIKRVFGRKSRFFILPVINATVREVPVKLSS